MDGLIETVLTDFKRYKEIVEISALVIFVVAFGLAAMTVLTRSFRFLRRMYAGEARGRFFPIAWTLMKVWRTGGLKKDETSKFFDRVRMRVEHEIFDPMPVSRYPVPAEVLGDLDENEPAHAPFMDPRQYAAATSAARDQTRKQKKRKYAVQEKAARKRAKKLHALLRDEWRERMDDIYDEDHQTIEVEDAGEINDESDAVQRYFDTLKSVGVTERLTFRCLVEIKSGFVSPIHLLAGLLTKFNEKWAPIIRRFDLDTQDYSELGLARAKDNSDLRQLQMFIYNCWLLWGPSIPICDCGAWQGKLLSLQYGYGDENNSVELVGERDIMVGMMRKLIETRKPTYEMALNAKVTGLLQYSSRVFEDYKKTDIPPALRASWGGEQDARPILFLTVDRKRDVIKETSAGVVSEGKIELIDDTEKSKYYSAYLWVIFVLERQDQNGVWRAIDALPRKRHSGEPWRDFIPFFEHGNIADPETCRLLKAQLADKAVRGLARIVETWGQDRKTVPFRFSYASAIDESGCFHPPLFPELVGGVARNDPKVEKLTLRDLVVKRLAEVNASAAKNADRLSLEGLVEMNAYSSAQGDHPYASCNLPGHVGAHYKAMNVGSTDADADDQAERDVEAAI